MKITYKLNNKFENFYTQNQKEVAKKISGGDYDLLCGWGWNFLDKFLDFCRMLNLFLLFDETPAVKYQRQMFKIWRLLTLYLFKGLLGIEFMNEVPDKLFSDMGLLKCLGFKKEEILHGTNKRGKGNTGPLHKDVISDGLSRISPNDIQELFNKIVKKLVKFGILGGKVIGIVDGTELKTTEKYENCGRKTVEHKKYDKYGKLVVIPETIYGFKVIFLYDYVSRIILSSKVVQIQEHENNYLLDLITQSLENGVVIEKLLIDRAYLDGESLWRIKHIYGIDFVIPGRTNMDITIESRSFRNDSQVIWEEKEYKLKDKSEKLKLYGVENLRVWDDYVEVSKKKEKHRKDFIPESLNSIVITNWKNHEFETGKEPVLITTLPVNKPLEISDLYDLRSLIENEGNRELKQGWSLKNYPQKTEWGLKSHVFMTMISFSLCHAFRTVIGQNLSNQGDRKFRRSQRCSKVIVFSGYFYGIYDIEEFALLLGKGPNNFVRGSPESVENLLKGECELVVT